MVNGLGHSLAATILTGKTELTRPSKTRSCNSCPNQLRTSHLPYKCEMGNPAFITVP
jgi:hypothetical protein